MYKAGEETLRKAIEFLSRFQKILVLSADSDKTVHKHFSVLRGYITEKEQQISL